MHEVDNWLDELAQQNHVKLQHSFTRKRDHIKQTMYRSEPDSCPDTLDLIGDVIPLPPSKRLGKTMLKLVRASVASKYGKNIDPLVRTNKLVINELKSIIENSLN